MGRLITELAQMVASLIQFSQFNKSKGPSTPALSLRDEESQFERRKKNHLGGFKFLFSDRDRIGFYASSSVRLLFQSSKIIKY